MYFNGNFTINLQTISNIEVLKITNTVRTFTVKTIIKIHGNA